jgi:hypothetical protein
MSTEKPAATVRLVYAPAGDVIVPEQPRVRARFEWGAGAPNGLLAEASSSHSETVRRQPAAGESAK